jgi:uncharacterized membrane protein YuzA (DUF378 family)
MKAFRWIVAILLVVGALNWGILGLFGVNVIDKMFGEMSGISRLLYVLVGLAGLVKLARLCGCCSGCGCGPKCSCNSKKR